MMADLQTWLGVDGGGSGTRTGIFDAQGSVLARGNASASNPHRVGVEAAVSAIQLGVQEALHDLASATPAAALRVFDHGFAGIAVGLAGRSHPAAGEVLRAALREWPEARIRVLIDDGELARAAAFAAGHGVLLAAGTGSAAWGRGPLGDHRCGGLGPSVGDEGSGHALGMAALRVVAEQWDAGEALPEWLRGHVPESPRTWERHLRESSFRACDLAPLIVEAAAHDDLARLLCVGAAEDLARLAAACVERCGINIDAAREPCVATSGSVALALRPWLEPLLADALGAHVTDALPGAFALLAKADGPVHGW
ncbi:MAG: hypothetical protein EXS14_07915 [Planctomycetes bacterium]|nr:hypothetical protein [Planctomycetota bacterium]